MGFEYKFLEDVEYVDSSQNSVIIQKFNKILEKNSVNTNLQEKIDTINAQFKEDKTPYNKLVEQIRWNTYYYKKYRQQTKLLVFIIFICIIMIALTKLQSSYFDEKSYSAIMGFVLTVAFIYIIYGLWDLLTRDNKNFDEYEFSMYGGGGGNSKNLPPIEEKDEKSKKCLEKQLVTRESINSSFLNKYF